jgi:hypothetical protein
VNRRAFLFAAAAAAAGPAWPREKRFARGVLWRVAHTRRGTSHVYGTLHEPDARLAEPPPSVQRALEASRCLMVEFLPDAYAQQRFTEAALFLDRQTLEEKIGAEDFARVLEQLAPMGLPREFVSQNQWDGLAAGSQGLATPDLAVLRGPVPRSVSVQAPPVMAAERAWVASVLVLLILGTTGGGFAAAAMDRRGGKPIDLVAIAPAFGAVGLTLGGLVIALLGGDPLGVAGIVVTVLVASAGYVWAAKQRAAFN